MPAFHVTPYTAQVHDLIGRPGEQRESSLDIVVPEQLGEGLAVIAAGSTLHVDLRLESVHEGILATGDVSVTADATCARCLEPFPLPVEVEFQELFAYSLGDGFDFEVREEHVDLEPVIRDAVVLALPFQPIDPAGCQPTQLSDGINLLLSDAERPTGIDPRWAALAALAEPEADQT